MNGRVRVEFDPEDPNKQYTCIVCGQGVALKANGRLLAHVDPRTTVKCTGSRERPLVTR